ncbi:hypothetical protein VKS41_008765 [Umbelopsis sp. WA50703]|jgi:hypothetical protein
MFAKFSSPSLTTMLILVLAAATTVTAEDGTLDRSALKPRSEDNSVSRIPVKNLFAALEKRQYTEYCDPGYFLCSDSYGGCCPDDTTCTSGADTCSYTYSSYGGYSSSGSTGTYVSLSTSAALAGALVLFAQL